MDEFNFEYELRKESRRSGRPKNKVFRPTQAGSSDWRELQTCIGLENCFNDQSSLAWFVQNYLPDHPELVTWKKELQYSLNKNKRWNIKAKLTNLFTPELLAQLQSDGIDLVFTEFTHPENCPIKESTIQNVFRSKEGWRFVAKTKFRTRMPKLDVTGGDYLHIMAHSDNDRRPGAPLRNQQWKPIRGCPCCYGYNKGFREPSRDVFNFFMQDRDVGGGLHMTFVPPPRRPRSEANTNRQPNVSDHNNIPSFDSKLTGHSVHDVSVILDTYYQVLARPRQASHICDKEVKTWKSKLIFQERLANRVDDPSPINSRNLSNPDYNDKIANELFASQGLDVALSSGGFTSRSTALPRLRVDFDSDRNLAYILCDQFMDRLKVVSTNINVNKYIETFLGNIITYSFQALRALFEKAASVTRSENTKPMNHGTNELTPLDAFILHHNRGAPDEIRPFDDHVDVECEICFAEQDVVSFSPCHHSFCSTCLRLYLFYKVRQAESTRFTCPAFKCSTSLDALVILWFLPIREVAQFMAICVEAELTSNPSLTRCIRCRSILAIRGGVRKDNAVSCCRCSTTFCYGCRQIDHRPAGCQDYGAFLKFCTKIFDSLESVGRTCPTCNTFWEKINGCNCMYCLVCRENFCWGCGADHDNYEYCEDIKKPLEVKLTMSEPTEDCSLAQIRWFRTIYEHFERTKIMMKGGPARFSRRVVDSFLIGLGFPRPNRTSNDVHLVERVNLMVRKAMFLITRGRQWVLMSYLTATKNKQRVARLRFAHVLIVEVAQALQEKKSAKSSAKLFTALEKKCNILIGILNGLNCPLVY